MAVEGRLDQRIKLRRAEKRPPVGGDFCSHLEALGLASAYRRRFGLIRLRPVSVGACRWSLGRPVIGADRTTRQKGGGRDRHQSADRNECVHFFSLERLVPFFGSSPMTSARTASRNWRCALASPADPP